MDLFVTRWGKRYGPYSEAHVREMIKSGKLSRRDLAWCDDRPDWAPLSEILTFEGPPPTPPSPSRENALPSIADFMECGADRLYRELVEHYLRSRSMPDVGAAVEGTASVLPEEVSESQLMHFIDATNESLGYNNRFWASATCREAFEMIIEIAIDVLPLGEKFASVEDALLDENGEVAFALFQIPTLNFAYSASTQRAQRKFMGIRKGIFG